MSDSGIQVIDFRYILVGSGWARATLVVGDTTVDVTVSYLHDSLKELLEKGERVEDRLLTLSPQQTLDLAEKIHAGIPGSA